MATIRSLCVLIAVLAVSACATPGGTVGVVAVGNVVKNNAPTLSAAVVNVGIPRHSASSVSSTLSSIPPARVRVLAFNDERKDPDMDGVSTAAFGVPMGRIRFAPSPATLFGQATIAEIKAAGHSVTDGAEDAQVTGAVLEFEARTDTTLFYWDVIGSLAVSLQISGARETHPGARIDYRARCMERTYVWPGEAVVAGVMSKCIGDFANMLRNDGRAADALRNLAMNATIDSGNAVVERGEITTQHRDATESAYATRDHRWSVSYPGGWKLDDRDRFVKITRGRAVLGIHTITDVADKSLDEVADAAIQEWERGMQNVNTFKRVSRQRMTLAGGLSAIAIVHHIGVGQVGKSQKVIAVVKNRGYLIDAETHLASWPDYERDFQRIIDSFRVQD